MFERVEREKDRRGTFLSLAFLFCFKFFFNAQSERFFEDHSYLFEKQNADLM